MKSSVLRYRKLFKFLFLIFLLCNSFWPYVIFKMFRVDLMDNLLAIQPVVKYNAPCLCLTPPPLSTLQIKMETKRSLYNVKVCRWFFDACRLDPIPFSCATYCRVIAIKPERESAHYRPRCYFYTLPEAGNGFRSFMGLYDVLISFIFSLLLARGIINVEQYWSINKVSLESNHC